MILKNINLVFIIMPFMLAGVLYSRIVKHKTGDALRDQLKGVQVMMIMFGAMLFVLWICMPITATLSSFGYPETVEDIQTPKKMLRLFQEYNHAIVRTTEAVYWLLFLMTFWFLTAMYQLMKIMMLERDKHLETKHDEKAL